MPFPGNLPNPGIKPVSLKSLALAGGFFLPVALLGELRGSLRDAGQVISLLCCLHFLMHQSQAELVTSNFPLSLTLGVSL